jgi:hypothetical protein
MAGTNQGPSPAAPEIAALQAELLAAALGVRSLPGGQTIRFPDAGYFEREPEIYVLNDNLAADLPVLGLPKPLRMMSHGELAAAARQRGDVAYWHFRPVVHDASGIRIGLDGRLAHGDANAPALGLSGVDVKFAKQGDQWIVSAPPTYVAA